MIDLTGRIAVVSGASAGIGRAAARRIVERGGRVVVNARRAERLTELVDSLGGDRAVACAGDAADAACAGAMLDAARQAFGSEADLVVVNAGRGLGGSVTTSDESQWQEMIQTNLFGAAKLIRESASRMLADIKARGDWQAHPHDIVVLGSTVGRHVSPFSSMYGSTKFAVNSLAEAARRELGPLGVRVSLIEPAIVVSEFQSVAGYTDDWFKTTAAKFEPLLEPDDIADTIAWIASRPARMHVNDVVIRPTRQDYP